MAITATFTANFSSFYDAVQKADVKLKDFGTGAEKVGGQLSRLGDSFSGRKLIQEATLMAEAVERIGGTSKLTQAELAKVGAKAQEAATKMRALGMEVPAGIQKIATETQNLTAKQNTLVGSLKNVAGAFGIAFSVQAVVSFLKGIVETAGAVADMADKLGISAEAAQRFTFAAKQTGASMETIDKALNTMNKNLAGGSNSTVAALDAINLEFADIRAMKPEDAFLAIAAGIQQLPEPMRQAQIAMELLGRSGADLLPAIKEGFVELGKTAPVASERAIRAIDEWSDKFDGWVANLKAKSIEAVAAILDPAAAHEEAVQRMARASGELPPIIPEKELNRIKQVPPALRLVTVSVDEERDAIRRLDAALKEQNAAAEKAVKAQQAWNEQLRSFRNFLGLRQMEDARAAMDASAKQIEANVELEFELGKMYNANAAALGAYAGNVGLYTQQWAGYMQLAPGVVKNITNSGKALENTHTTLKKFGEAFGDVATILDAIPGKFAEIGVMAARTGQAIMENLGKGDWMGALVAGGAGVVGIFSKLWGGGEKKKVDEIRQAFIDQIGGWEGLNLAAQNTGMTLTRVLNAKTVKEYEAAVRELQDAIAFQDSAMATLDETTKRYGFTLEELGPAMQRQELDKQAQQLFKDWEVLNAAGIDTVAITSRMSESINAYLQQAMALGTEVPAAMKPMLEEMVRMGQLTDASGNRIDSLEDAGISFAMTMSEGFKALIDEVGKLTQAIARGLGVALDATTDKIVRMPKTIGVDVVYNDPGFHGEIQVPAGEAVPSFATGSGGKYLNFGSGTLAMLHGREKITPAGASEGGDVSELRAEVQGLRADLARQQRLLPKQLRDALLLAS